MSINGLFAITLLLAFVFVVLAIRARDLPQKAKIWGTIYGLAFLGLAVAFGYVFLAGFGGWYVYEEMAEPRGTSVHRRLMLMTFGGAAGSLAAVLLAFHALRRR